MKNSFRIRHQWKKSYYKYILKVKKKNDRENIERSMTYFLFIVIRKPEYIICSDISISFGLGGYIMKKYISLFYKCAFEEISFYFMILFGFIPTVKDKYININSSECPLTLIFVYYFVNDLKNEHVEIKIYSNLFFNYIN